MWIEKNQGRRSAMKGLRSAALIVMLGAAASAVAAPPAENDVLRTRANTLLGLSDSHLVTLELNRSVGAVQQVAVPIAGTMRVLDIASHSVRSPKYQIKAQVADGSLVDVPAGPVRTIRGTVIGDEAGVVAGTIDEHGLSAMVLLGDGERYWIEPLLGRVEGASAVDHVVYGDADAMPTGRSCATAVANRLSMLDPDGATPEGPTFGCDGLPCEVELACDADFQFQSAWGGVAGTEARINNVMNVVNIQYERDVGITHRITTIIVRTSEPDPYSTSDCGDLLMQFQAEWLANQQQFLVDEHQLFSGQQLVGCAGIALGINVICTNNAFCVVDNEVGFIFATDVSAHELGHLWGGIHCDCVNPDYTMNPFLTGANRFNPNLNIPNIVQHRETRSCLDTAAPATSLPFFDAFDGPDIDETMWFNGAATISDLGDGEPSGTTSLRLSGSARLTSGFLDATGLDTVGVEYWWQRTGNSGGSPEAGEDLALEYKSTDGFWREGDRQLGDPGGGGDNLPYERACAILPADTNVDALQIRLRIFPSETSNLSGADNFFVDDLSIVNGSELLNVVTPPEFDCACDAGTAEFSVDAVGELPLSYQWRFNGTPIPGATDATLVISPVQPQDFGLYSVVVENGCGATLTTEEVVLLEATQPAIVVPPQDTSVAPGETLALFVIAAGECPEFQWFFNGEPIANANGSFLFIPDMQCADQGCYTVVVFNDCASVMSDAAQVTVDSCGPLNCSMDATPPEIVHGSGQQGETRPFSGYIDPRSESSNGVDLNRGITEVALLFSEPVDSVGGGPLTPDAFIVTETGGAAPPTVDMVDASAMPLVVLTLSRPPTLQEWTTIQAVVQDQSDPPNVIVDGGDQGPGVNESDRIDIGFLPADINQTGNVNPLDLLTFKQFVNGVQTPPLGTLEDFIDINRDGVVNPLDLLSFKQLINGVSPPSTIEWALESMNNTRP